MKNKPLKAFTIIEALFSMLLLSLIVSMVYLISNLLSKQLVLFEKENTEIINYNFFDSVFMTDLNNSTDFKFNDNQINLYYYNSMPITYIINKSNILRVKNRAVDTLKIYVKSYEIFKVSEIKSKLFLKVNLLHKDINTNYYLQRCSSVLINEKFYNED